MEGAMSSPTPSGVATPTAHDEKRVIELSYLAFALLVGVIGASSPSERSSRECGDRAHGEARGDARTDDR